MRGDGADRPGATDDATRRRLLPGGFVPFVLSGPRARLSPMRIHSFSVGSGGGGNVPLSFSPGPAPVRLFNSFDGLLSTIKITPRRRDYRQSDKAAFVALASSVFFPSVCVHLVYTVRRHDYCASL